MNSLLLLLVVLLGGLVILGMILLARWSQACDWQRSLVAYRLRLPADLTADSVAAWLATVSAATHAPWWVLLPPPPLALEVVSSVAGIEHILLVPEKMSGAILATLRGALPGIRVEDLPEYLKERPRFRVAAEGVVTNHQRPLGAERAEVASNALLASLHPLYGSDKICVQWIVTGSKIPSPVRSVPAHKGQSDSAWWLDGDISADPEEVRAARQKLKSPLIRAVVRVGVAASERRRAYSLFGRVWGCLRILNAPGVGIVRRWWLPVSVISQRIQQLAVPLAGWPLTLNVAELSGLLGFPVGTASLPGLSVGSARQLPAPVSMSTDGAVLGVSNYPGSKRLIALRPDDRLRHSWIVGPTGVGKSTLLANLIVQDMAAGRGLVLLDPKGDLVADVLDRVPEHRRDDVLVIDPSATDQPVGVNILHTRADELHRELAVDTLVHTLASLWRGSWGPRTSDVLRSALLTLTHTKAVDGSAFTLVELPELLMNPRFRGFVTAQPAVPPTVRPFWSMYEQMSEGEKLQVIGPSLNKLRSFTTRSSLRLMLGQSTGINLADVFTKRRIVLVPLSKGLLGSETTALIGSLLMAQLWQAALERITVAPKKRHPVMFYLDEFQDFLRLPLGLADMLSQARGYGVGMVLGHQYLHQLNDDVRTAIQGTTRTHVTYQLNYDDATTLARSFAPLTTQDLMGLDRYEIAVRPCVDGQTLAPVTAATLALPEITTDGPALAQASRGRFGTSRANVEAALRARIVGNDPPTLFGIEQRGGRP